jgi:hypothetical protein
MIDVQLYTGEVVDTNDPDQKGRVKVRLLPEMKDAQESHLPWVYPFLIQSMTEDAFSHIYPDQGSLVWCFFTSDSFHTGYFISSVFLEDIFDYSVVEDAISNISEVQSPQYPQAKFTKYSDGTVVFTNTDTGDMGVYHSSGTYTVIDRDGGVFVKSNKNIKLYNGDASIEMKEDGTIEQTNDSGLGNTFTITSDGFEFNGNAKTLVRFQDLKTVLSTVFQTQDTAVIADPLSGVAGPTQVPVKPTFDSQISLAEATNMLVPGT